MLFSLLVYMLFRKKIGFNSNLKTVFYFIKICVVLNM